MKHLTVEENLTVVPPQEFNKTNRLLYQWEVMEDIQDNMSYHEWGWYGFVPLLIYRS